MGEAGEGEGEGEGEGLSRCGARVAGDSSVSTLKSGLGFTKFKKSHCPDQNQNQNRPESSWSLVRA